MIIHFKRQQGRPMLDSDYDGTIDGVITERGAARAAQHFLGARVFTTAWSLGKINFSIQYGYLNMIQRIIHLFYRLRLGWSWNVCIYIIFMDSIIEINEI